MTFTVGDVRFTVISDGPLAIGPARDCFPDLSQDEALDAFGTDGAAEVRLPQNLLIADVRGTRILFDTGLGPTFTGSVGRDAGQARANLREAGIEPDSVDLIAISHAHPDHVGGLIADDGTAVFARAEVLIARPEYEDVFGAREETEPETFTARQRDFARRSLASYRARMRCLEDGDELVGGVTLMSSPGHSPGHAAFAIDTAAGRVLSWGDTCHHDVLLRRPDLRFSTDHDSHQAARSRHRLLARIASAGWRVHAYHLPYPGIGEVRARAEGGYVWVTTKLDG